MVVPINKTRLIHNGEVIQTQLQLTTFVSLRIKRIINIVIIFQMLLLDRHLGIARL